MKNYLTFIIMVLFIGVNYSQTYTYTFPTQQGTRWVEIKLDTLRFKTAIHVEKNFLPDNTSVNQNPSDLILMGDFIIEGDSALLDYANYRYYWIPFNPRKPFYSLNNGDRQDDDVPGFIRFGKEVDPEAEMRSGDLNFMCSCNRSTTNPSNCKSSLKDGTIQCVLDTGDRCPEGCIGKVLTSNGNFVGGGIIIQVDETKSKLYHNFNTR